MSSFSTNKASRTPFGKNVYLRSTRDQKTNSYTFASGAIPTETIDGSTQKVLQPGTVVARITSGPDTGKIGVFQAAGTDEVQTLTGTGTISGGTYGLTVMGVAVTGIAFNATASTVQAAVRLAIANSTLSDADKAIGDGITITGGPINSAPLVVTFDGEYGSDVTTIVTSTGTLTGTTPGISVATGTPGAVGATDGRQLTANIVGIVETFLPWQLLERDVEVSVTYEAAVVQAWCFEYNAAGQRIALTNTTRDAIVARADLALLFPINPVAV